MAINTEVIDAGKYFEYAVDSAAHVIGGGGIAALPTETVYGLAASGLDERAVSKVFEAKGRPSDNPLIVHISDLNMLREVVSDIPEKALALMRAFWPGPLSIILPKLPCIPTVVTGGLDTVAVRMPSHPVMRAVIARAGVPIAAPSANISGKPSPTSAAHVQHDLSGRIPLIIDGGACGVGVESTVMDMTGQKPVILRPGAVTAHMVSQVTGDVKIYAGTLSGTPPSPGMKYRHYAPKASVYFFEGNKNEVAQNIVSLYYLCNENALVLCPDECLPLYAGINALGMGITRGQAEAALFSRLRAADDECYGSIYFHYAEYMGEAVKNRILRGAEIPGRE